MVDYVITASAEDRRDLAQHHAGVPLAVLQALIAFVGMTLNGSGDIGCKSHELDFADL